MRPELLRTGGGSGGFPASSAKPGPLLTIRRMTGKELLTLGIRTRVRTEIRWFVHIDPQRIDINACLRIEELKELIVPVLLSAWVEPIRENRRTRPYHASINRPVWILLKDVEIDAIVVGFVVECRHGWIDHDDVVLLVSVEVVDQLADHVEWEPFRIESEDPSKVHVIDIRPHSLGLSAIRIFRTL